MADSKPKKPSRREQKASQQPVYPAATLAFYGPNDQYATKVVATLVMSESDQSGSVCKKWRIQEGDIRNDPGVRQQILEFMQVHGVKRVVMPDRIIGCPHEEGIDYPRGEQCPYCPFWATHDRWTGKPTHP